MRKAGPNSGIYSLGQYTQRAGLPEPFNDRIALRLLISEEKKKRLNTTHQRSIDGINKELNKLGKARAGDK